jgi:transcription antitermination factor NusG
MLSVVDNPVARYPEGRPLEDSLGVWAVAQVKSRQEKALAWDLASAGIPYYMPMGEKRTRRRDNGKVRKSVIPLFTGYLALGLAREDWERVFRTARVATVIPVDDQRGFVRELNQIERSLASRFRVSLAPAFAVGQLVRVKHGPLMGLEGEVARVKGQAIFVVWVRMFSQAVRIEVDELDLEPM